MIAVGFSHQSCRMAVPATVSLPLTLRLDGCHSPANGFAQRAAILSIRQGNSSAPQSRRPQPRSCGKPVLHRSWRAAHPIVSTNRCAWPKGKSRPAIHGPPVERKSSKDAKVAKVSSAMNVDTSPLSSQMARVIGFRRLGLLVKSIPNTFTAPSAPRRSRSNGHLRHGAGCATRARRFQSAMPVPEYPFVGPAAVTSAMKRS